MAAIPQIEGLELGRNRHMVGHSFLRWARRFALPLHELACRLTGDAAAAKRVASETLLRGWAQLEGFMDQDETYRMLADIAERTARERRGNGDRSDPVDEWNEIV